MDNFTHDDIAKLRMKTQKKVFQAPIFKPYIDVALIVKSIPEEGLKQATNGNLYLTLNTEVHPSAAEHAGQNLMHMVWEKSKFTNESLEEFAERKCPLKLLLTGYFSDTELIEGRWQDKLQLLKRIVGSVIKATPGKKKVDQESDVITQNLNDVEVVSPVAGVNINVNPAAVGSIAQEVTTNVPF